MVPGHAGTGPARAALLSSLGGLRPAVAGQCLVGLPCCCSIQDSDLFALVLNGAGNTLAETEALRCLSTDEQCAPSCLNDCLQPAVTEHS